jgi:transposase
MRKEGTQVRWTEQQVEWLRHMCLDGISNSDIADNPGCQLGDVYAKRSQMGLTIEKYKAMNDKAKTVEASEETNTKPEARKAYEKPSVELEKAPKGLYRSVKIAIDDLNIALLIAAAGDGTSEKNAKVYLEFGSILKSLELSFNELIEY